MNEKIVSLRKVKWAIASWMEMEKAGRVYFWLSLEVGLTDSCS